MGIIKDGSVSGILPTNNKVFAVHYPAYPSSVEHAVETLGGIQGIVKARTSESNKLELHFRPEDPYSHPAFGELKHSNNFLLKISKSKVRDVQTAERRCGISSSSPVNSEQENSCAEQPLAAQMVNESRSASVDASKEFEVQTATKLQEHLSADIVSHVAEAYHFNGMVDYQHVLAVHADVARRKKRQWAEVEPKFEKGGLMDVDQEDLMILVPPLFSLKDMPDNIILKPCASVSSKKKQEGLVRQNWEREIEWSLCIDFEIKEIPKPVDWEKHIPQGSDQWRQQKAVCELFEERQIWAKESLAERLLDGGLVFGGSMLKRLLFRVAYYFSKGPFRRFWIRKGYDPRKDPESRIYQNIDFRVNHPKLISYIESHASSGLKHRWDDICAFRVFPYKCQISLQLCELKDDYIQQEIRKPSTQEICDSITGWFSSDILKCLRLCIAVRFMSVCPHPDAESLLKSASASFEKSKRSCTYVKVARPEGREKLNKVVEHKEVAEQEENNEVDEPDDLEDDEDESEDDVEDEMDAYECLDLEGDVSPSHDPHTNQDNVSRGYLQELFGNYQFSTEGMDEVQDDQSLGEYEIYDQYSDGSYSEDED